MFRMLRSKFQRQKGERVNSSKDKKGKKTNGKELVTGTNILHVDAKQALKLAKLHCNEWNLKKGSSKDVSSFPSTQVALAQGFPEADFRLYFPIRHHPRHRSCNATSKVRSNSMKERREAMEMARKSYHSSLESIAEMEE